jgi:hypothetical protein
MVDVMMWRGEPAAEQTQVRARHRIPKWGPAIPQFEFVAAAVLPADLRGYRLLRVLNTFRWR